MTSAGVATFLIFLVGGVGIVLLLVLGFAVALVFLGSMVDMGDINDIAIEGKPKNKDGSNTENRNRN